jgi:hypothetical protein
MTRQKTFAEENCIVLLCDTGAALIQQILIVGYIIAYLHLFLLLYSRQHGGLPSMFAARTF